MKASDAQRAKQAIAVIASMLRSMEERGDDKVDASVLTEIRAITATWTGPDQLVGFLRASGTALSRLALERRCSIDAAAKDVSVTIRRLSVSDALGIEDADAHDDAVAAAGALAGC